MVKYHSHEALRVPLAWPPQNAGMRQMGGRGMMLNKLNKANKPPLVSNPQALDSHWLNQMLAHIGYPGQVAAVHSEAIGTGQTAHSERFVLTLEGQPDPLSFVGKFPSPDATSRATGHNHGSYMSEVCFYQQLASTVAVTLPKLVYTDINPDNSDFVLLLEDAAPAQQGDQLAGCDAKAASAVLYQAAALHAPRWGDASLAGHGFLNGADGSQPLTSAVVDALWQQFLARYAQRLPADIIAVGETLVAGWSSYSQPYTGPKTLIHGDFRLDNLLFDVHSDGVVKVTVVDWQTVGLGCAAHDVAYFLGSSFTPEVRRDLEPSLLAEYLEQLQRRGIQDYSYEQLWFDYRRYSYAGYFMAVIASILVEQTPRGDDMFMLMAMRHGQQVIDLDSAATL